MAEPPPRTGKTEDPLCKTCGKTMKSHSYLQQLKCEKEEKKKIIE